MFAIAEAAQWAQENFGRCDLGDKRRVARLVRIAGDLARNTGALLLKSCDGDEAAAEELRTTSSNPTSVNKGFIVHSVVLLDGCTGATVGLIEQRRWIRVADEYGKNNERKRRAYEDKESFKWQQAGQGVRTRLGETLSQRAIAICDREVHSDASIRCHALLAAEQAAPEGSEPVERLLLATEPVTTHAEALNVLWM